MGKSGWFTFPMVSLTCCLEQRGDTVLPLPCDNGCCGNTAEDERDKEELQPRKGWGKEGLELQGTYFQ